MKSVLWSPQIEAAPAPPAPGPRRLRLAALVAVGTAILLLSPTQVGVARQGAFVAFSVTIGTLLLAMYATSTEVRRGAIRVRSDGVLRFVPRARLAGTYWLYVCLGLVPGALAAFGGYANPERSLASDAIATLVLGAVSMLMLVRLTQLIRQLRFAVGLAVSEQGLSGVRNGGPVEISWDELRAVSAMAIPSGELVAFGLASGKTVLLRGLYIGSDPSTVASIIEHFRTHPGDRGLLVEGGAAVRAVEAASRAFHDTDPNPGS